MTELGHTPTFVGVLEDIHEPGKVDAMFDRIDEMKDKMHNVKESVQANYEHLQEKYRVKEKLEEGRKYANEHPIMTLFVSCTICMCAFPLACFMAFVVSSVFFTFLGCLFVEGFLLTVGGFFLVVSLFVVGFLSLLFSSFLLASWYSIHLGHKLLDFAQGKLNSRRQDGYVYAPEANGDCVKDK